MSQNTSFEALVPPMYLNYPYFFPSQLPNLENFVAYQMENFNAYQYYQAWNNQNYYQCAADPIDEKIDCLQQAQQSSAGTKQSEITMKPKRTQAPRFRPTKNNESNISNQTFSFVTSEGKSKNILQIFLKNKKKTQIFYNYCKFLTSKRKKYMSKSTLLKLCTLTEFMQQFQGLEKIKMTTTLTLKQFESGVRFLVLYFLKQKSISSILTSQKIAGNLKKDHICKVREIVDFIEEGLEAQRKKQIPPEMSFQIKIQY